MTPADRLNEWTKADEVFCMIEQRIPLHTVCKKFKTTAKQARNLVEQGRRRREQRTKHIERVRLVWRDQIDAAWQLPEDVFIARPEAIVMVQQGCELGTLLQALCSRGE
jgi:hypothetical protein